MKKSRDVAVPMKVSDDDWKARQDFETMIEAEKIERDPKRMGKVKALAQQRMLDAAKIASEGKDES